MQFESGYIELTNDEISMLSYVFMQKIERHYEANAFIAELVDIQTDLENGIRMIALLNDKDPRKGLESDLMQLTRYVAKMFEERAGEVMEVAGNRIEIH